MTNMMENILLYSTFILIALASFGLISAGFIYTINYFRAEDKRLMQFALAKKQSPSNIR